MRKMSVDHQRRFSPEPAIEANPSTRIGQAFPHPEAQESYSGCGQLGCRIASVA
jgi:hypothetical protein